MRKLTDICTSVDSTSDSFVGVKYEHNDVKIIFPLGFRLSTIENDLLLDVKTLFKLIKIVKEKNVDYSEIGSASFSAQGLPIDSYQWIIEDYLKNGIFVDNETEYMSDKKGKINWKRTFKTKFLVNKKSIVYLNPIVEKKANIKNVISEIHSYCIDKSTSNLWFLYNNVSKVSSVKKPNLKYYLKIINSEILNTFDDRKKILLHHMRKVVIENIDNKNKAKIKNYGIYRFEYVWEYLIDEVFSTEDITKFYPKSTYFINGSGNFDASKLRPDTMMRDAFNNFYIIDAKYYKVGFVANTKELLKRNLPNTDSIQKQLTYGDFIYNNYIEAENIKTIFNAFILPYNKDQNNFNLKNNIEYIGYATADWSVPNEIDKEYLKIAIILMDTKYLIDSYVLHSKEKEKLSEEIKKVSIKSI